MAMANASPLLEIGAQFFGMVSFSFYQSNENSINIYTFKLVPTITQTYANFLVQCLVNTTVSDEIAYQGIISFPATPGVDYATINYKYLMPSEVISGHMYYNYL